MRIRETSGIEIEGRQGKRDLKSDKGGKAELNGQVHLMLAVKLL
jgi:hypothetical protein